MWRSEPRLSLVIVVASAAVFGLALILAPPFDVSFDEAKYLGIGYSLVEGHGPQIVFGGYFLLHGPIWPTVVVAPAVAFGLDPLSVGRFLNGVSGVGLVLLSAALAWRIRPAAAAVAAVGLLATTYVHELARTSRLDVPAAALCVAYLALGLVAFRRGSARLGIAAGLLFAVAFLVKEIVLPLGPVPILAAILHRQPWRSILRVTGWLIVVATVAVAPWFLFFAQQTHLVYRLGTPAWTLAPIGLTLLGVGVGAILAGRRRALTSGSDDDRRPGRSRSWIVVGLVTVWSLALLLVFNGKLTTRATTVIDIRQIVRYVRTWYPYLVTSAVGAVGILLSLRAVREADRSRREAYEDLWLATICGLPLVILVVGIGEPPRHYLAQLAIGAGLAAGGWLWLFEAAFRRWPMVTTVLLGAAFGTVIGLAGATYLGIGAVLGAVGGLVVGVLSAAAILAVRARTMARAVAAGPDAQAAVERSVSGGSGSATAGATAGLLLGGLVAASALLAYTIRIHPPTTTRELAVSTVAAWVRANVPPGSTLAFGSFLSYEMALPLRASYGVRQVRHVLAVGDVNAPDGIEIFGKPERDDWVSVDIQPNSVNGFQGFSAGLLIDGLRRSGATYWVYSTGPPTAAPSIIAALQGAAGFEPIMHWTFPGPSGRTSVDTYVYRLDRDRLALDVGRIYMSPEAIDQMLTMIEDRGASDLARRLGPQVVVTPRSDAGDLSLARLRQLGGG
jgi:4-amino-4-deoxy-L-arabinose transferase-like glycosyltransferase